MKRLLYLLMVVLCIFALIGCGEIKKTKLTAKMIDNSDSIGRVECQIEVIFSNGIVSNVKEERRFSSKEAAEEYYNLLLLLNENTSGVEVERSGSKVIEKADSPSSSYKYYGLSKTNLVAELEAAGWTID